MVCAGPAPCHGNVMIRSLAAPSLRRPLLRPFLQYGLPPAAKARQKVHALPQARALPGVQPLAAPPPDHRATLLQAEPRAGRLPAAAPPEQEESALTAVRELFGHTGNDPGHYNFSPEWWGNQDGGWGRDAGQTVFAADSACGNGKASSCRVAAQAAAARSALPAGLAAAPLGAWRAAFHYCKQPWTWGRQSIAVPPC